MKNVLLWRLHVVEGVWMLTPQFENELIENSSQVNEWALGIMSKVSWALLVLAVINMAVAATVLMKKPTAWAVMQKGDVVELDLVQLPSSGRVGK